MAKKSTANEFSSGYRFVKDGRIVAILDPNGRFCLKDENASLETFPNWRDYMKQQKVAVAGESEEEVTIQLEMTGLGVAEPIERTADQPAPVTREAKPEPPKPKAAAKSKTSTDSGEDTVAKTPAKKTAPAKKAAASTKTTKPAPKAENPCLCGCGTKVARNFAQGHDARFHGWGKKIADGRMKFSDISGLTKDAEFAIKNLKADGVKQGTAAK